MIGNVWWCRARAGVKLHPSPYHARESFWAVIAIAAMFLAVVTLVASLGAQAGLW